MSTLPIANLLIDLGGVLYEIDIETTVRQYNDMRKAGAPPVIFNKKTQHDYFSQLDCGQIEIDEFATGLKQTYQLEGSIEDIKSIWTSLLIGVLPGRIEALQKLSPHYRLALLSNTSRYHRDHYADECEPMFSLMDHLCYSFEMGLRKPGKEIYLQALETLGWKAEETLFLDDSKNNIDAAEALGFQTAWIREHDDFLTVVDGLLTKV
ncbi:MAG: HAD family phosphatase [Bacteroidota bacterium]